MIKLFSKVYMEETIVQQNNVNKNHKLKKLREHTLYLCLTCGEIVKSDGNTLEGNEFHGLE